MEDMISLKHMNDELKMIKARMVTREEFEKAIDTISILSNEDTMEQIRESEKNIFEGKVEEINSVSELDYERF